MGVTLSKPSSRSIYVTFQPCRCCFMQYGTTSIRFVKSLPFGGVITLFFFSRPFPHHIMQGTKVPAWLVADPQYQRCTIAWRPNHLCLRGTNLLGGWTNPYSKKITTHPDIAHRSAIPETANYERDPQSSLFVKVFFGCVPKVCWNNLRHMQNMRPSNWIISPRLRVKIIHIWVATS